MLKAPRPIMSSTREVPDWCLSSRTMNRTSPTLAYASQMSMKTTATAAATMNTYQLDRPESTRFLGHLRVSRHSWILHRKMPQGVPRASKSRLITSHPTARPAGPRTAQRMSEIFSTSKKYMAYGMLHDHAWV